MLVHVITFLTTSGFSVPFTAGNNLSPHALSAPDSIVTDLRFKCLRELVLLWCFGVVVSSFVARG